MTKCDNEDCDDQGCVVHYDIPDDIADPILAGIHAAMKVAYDAGRVDAAEALHLLPGSSVWRMVAGRDGR